MPDQPQRVRLEEIDWRHVLPWVRLFTSFRMAIHAPKLLLALLLVILVYLAGTLMDQVWPGRVLPGEVQRFTTLSREQYDAWLTDQADPRRIEAMRFELAGLLRRSKVPGQTAGEVAEDLDFGRARAAINDAFAEQYDSWMSIRRQIDTDIAEATTTEERQTHQRRLRAMRSELDLLDRSRAQSLEALHQLQPQGVFATMLELTVERFETIVRAAVSFNFGFSELAEPPPAWTDSVVGGIRGLAFTMPAWLWHSHPWFMIVYGTIFLAIWALLAGTISRLAALHAARDERQSSTVALRFALRRWLWFFLTPLIPLIMILLIGLALVAGGFVLFNWPVLDVVGSLLFPLALAAGVFIAMVIVALLGSAGLLFPAVAVEGTDAFDAISRAFSYVLNRPWRWLFYNVVALVYGAITYIFIGAVIFLTLLVVHQFAGAGVFRDAAPFVNRFEAIMPQPQFGELAYAPDLARLPVSARIAAVVVSIWVNLFIAVLAAYAISYLLTAQTWVYLLLRRGADGTDLSEVYSEADEAPAAAPTPEPTGTSEGDAAAGQTQASSAASGAAADPDTAGT